MKRESTQFPSVSIVPIIESPSPLFMGEGKSVFEIGPDSSNKDGYWRAAMGVLKDDGYLRIFSDVCSSFSESFPCTRRLI